MNMLRIAICDDEIQARDALRFQLEKVTDDRMEQIVYEFNSGARAVHWLEKHPGEIDLLFLDVEMDEMNGMEAAMEIRKFNQDIIIVFVTGYTDYVFDGYKVGALDYIIKPASTDRLKQLVNRVRATVAEQSDDYYSFQNIDGTFKLSLRDILYFYSDRRLIYVVTAGKEYFFYDKMNNVAAQLSDNFVRVHQRYLVNGKKVDQIKSSAVVVSSIELPISRALKEDATRALANIMLGGRV